MNSEIKERIAKIQNGEVPEGYKVTKAGVIPESWGSIKLAKLFNFKNGLNKEKEFFGQGTPIVNYTDVYKNSGLLESDIIGRVTLSENEIERYNVKSGDVFFTRTSETVQEIGYTSVILYNPIDTVFSGFILRARPYTNKLSKDFCKYAFSTYTARKEIIKKSSYTTRALTNGKFLGEVILSLPSYPEQQKIAAILSTWDKAITLQEKLIAQKKEQKRGLMQRLLAGKLRLPGFDVEWKYYKASEIFKSISDKKHLGIGRVLSSTQENGIVPRDEVDIDIKYNRDSLSSYKKVLAGQYVISLRSFQGGIEYSEYEGLLSPAYTILDKVIPINGSYYKHLFKSNDLITRLNSLIYGIRDGKQIGYKDFSTLILPYPSPEEQKRIGVVLDMAESEIEVLEKQNKAICEQKKGLMQLLLTGKVRVKV